MGEKYVFKVGGSLAIRLPLDWRREHRITENSRVKIYDNPDGSLTVIPVGGTVGK